MKFSTLHCCKFSCLQNKLEIGKAHKSPEKFFFHINIVPFEKTPNLGLLKYQFSLQNVKSYNWIASSIVTTLSETKWWDHRQTRQKHFSLYTVQPKQLRKSAALWLFFVSVRGISVLELQWYGLSENQNRGWQPIITPRAIQSINWIFWKGNYFSVMVLFNFHLWIGIYN